jgi:hypothetical protein
MIADATESRTNTTMRTIAAFFAASRSSASTSAP